MNKKRARPEFFSPNAPAKLFSRADDKIFSHADDEIFLQTLREKLPHSSSPHAKFSRREYTKNSRKIPRVFLCLGNLFADAGSRDIRYGFFRTCKNLCDLARSKRAPLRRLDSGIRTRLLVSRFRRNVRRRLVRRRRFRRIGRLRRIRRRARVIRFRSRRRGRSLFLFPIRL